MNNWERLDEIEGVKKQVEVKPSGDTKFGPRYSPKYQTPVPVSTWFWLNLLIAIPIVNIIALLLMAFSGSLNENIQNFAKAALIWMLIGIVIYITILS